MHMHTDFTLPYKFTHTHAYTHMHIFMLFHNDMAHYCT